MRSRRLLVLAGALFFAFSALLFQFFKIQVLQHERWRSRAEAQHYFYVEEPFVRGTFWSNTTIKKGHREKERPFAIDVCRFHLYVDPKSIPEELKSQVAEELLAHCRPRAQERERFVEQFYKPSRSRKLLSWLDEKAKEEILTWWRPFAKEHTLISNALFFVKEHKRSHPFGRMLGQVLHTLQEANAQPTGGLELSLDRYLRGKPGRRRFLRSPRHLFETESIIQEPVDGADIYLTINHILQAIAEEEIERGVKKSKAKGGWAVMMDPHTGAILALAQYPAFYPDYYSLYFNRPGLIQHSKVKALTDAYEPGSTMKPITIALALKANKILKSQGKKPIFHPLEKIDTSKGNFPGRGNKPLKDTHFHHYLNMYLGIQKSSNIYVATLVHRMINALGSEWYRNELTGFGFGRKTAIELPGESAGKLPMPGKLHPNGKLEWSQPTPYSLAMGHNIQATTLQMLRAHAAFANGGYLVEPTLIRKIVKRHKSGRQEVVLDNSTRDTRTPILDADIVKEVVQCMKFITKRGGTAPRANIWGYTEAGKTGTSMKVVQGSYSSKSHFPNFIGFAPLSQPAFILLVGLDDPEVGYVPGIGLAHHAGECAAPIFREIGARTLEYLGIPQDDPHGYPTGDPRHDAAKADWMKEVEKMHKLYHEWNA